MQCLASCTSGSSRGASSRIPAKVARPVNPFGAKKSSSKNGMRGRRLSLPRRPSINGQATSSRIIVPAILHVLQPQPQLPQFFLLPPILAPAANTGVLFNHGVYVAAATAARAVATTTTMVAATRMAMVATQQRRRDGGIVTTMTQQRQHVSGIAAAAGIYTDNNQLVPP